MEVVTPFGWVPTPIGRAGRRASKRPVVFTISTEVRRFWAEKGEERIEEKRYLWALLLGGEGSPPPHAVHDTVRCGGGRS